MNGRIGEFVAKYWWKIVVGVFLAGGLWNQVQGKISNHEDRIDRVEHKSEECHDFIQRQLVINEQMSKMDKKLDRLLSRR